MIANVARGFIAYVKINGIKDVVTAVSYLTV